MLTNKEQLTKTIAHELGHGYFQLKHPFEMGLKQGDLKDNLMDYDQGVAFNKYQWDIMHDPGIVTGLFESDTSGMLVVDCGGNGKPEKIKALITALKTCSGVDDAVAKLSDPELSNYLCAEERKDIIKCIAKGFRVGTEDEKNIIRVIKTTPLNQKEQLVNLMSAEPNLLANLHSSIDGDELTTYYKELIFLYRLSKPKNYWDNLANNFDNIEGQKLPRTMKEWAQQKIFFWLDVGLLKYFTEGQIFYHNEEITSNNRLKFDQYTSIIGISLNEVKGVDLAPFEVIRLHFLSENEELGISKGEYVDMPAIVLRFLIQKQFNREAWLAVNSGFILGTLGSGSIATLWGKVDCALGLGAILEDNYHNQLMKTTEGQAVLTAWKALNVALIARLGYTVATSIPTAWQNLTNAIAKLRVKNPTLATQVENEAKQVFAEYNVVDDVAKGAGKTVGSIGNIGDNLISSVTGDIRKFSEYALTNPSKKGLFVDSWGYKLSDAEELLNIYKQQAIEAIKNGKVISNGVDKLGNQVYQIETILNTPLKGIRKIYAGWIVKPDKIDELILSSLLADR